MSNVLRGPGCRLVPVARRTRIGHLVLVRFAWRNKAESVSTDESTGNALGLDLRHVTRYALATAATYFMMRVRFKRNGSRTIWRRWPVTVQTELLGGLSQLRVVRCAMHIVAGCTGHSPAIHQTLHEIVPLHPVLMSSAIGKVQECRLT